METTAAAHTVTTELGFEAATTRCREALAAEGFGVLRVTLQLEPGVDRRRLALMEVPPALAPDGGAIGPS